MSDEKVGTLVLMEAWRPVWRFVWYRGWYHFVVSNAVKLISRMRRHPRDWRIEDLKVVADRAGIDYDQHGTSHVVFRHPEAGRLSVPARRPIKPVYVRLFVDLVDRAGGNHED